MVQHCHAPPLMMTNRNGSFSPPPQPPPLCLTIEVELKGEPVAALLDTGSPVTITSLDFLLKVWGKIRPPGQKPEQWQASVEKRLEPTTVTLCKLRWWTTASGETGSHHDLLTRTQHGGHCPGTERCPSPAAELGFLFLCRCLSASLDRRYLGFPHSVPVFHCP